MIGWMDCKPTGNRKGYIFGRVEGNSKISDAGI